MLFQGLSVAREALCPRVLCSLLAGFAGPGVHAAEWAIEPAVSVRTEYNDNLRLAVAHPDRVTMSALSPQLTLRKKTEVSDVSLRGLVNLNGYWDAPALNTTDYLYNLDSSFTNERSTFGLDAAYVRDSTLASELRETGVVTTRAQRSSQRANPQWSWRFSPLSSVGVSYAFADVSYAAARSTGLIDYRNQDISFWVSHKLGEHSDLQFGGYFSKYATRPASYEADTRGITLSYSSAFSERTKLTGQIGMRSTESSRQAFTQIYVPTIFPGLFQIVLVPQRVDSKDSGPVLNIGIESQWSARTSLHARLSRELNPSGRGSLVENDRISFGATYGFSERTSFNVDAAAYRARFSDAALSASNSRYYTLETRLNSRLDEHWSVGAGYRYARLEYQNAAQAADANVIFVSARYDWPKIAVSR